MHPMDVVVDEVMAELENGMSDHPDPIMALADCVGIVLLHWDALDVDERRRVRIVSWTGERESARLDVDPAWTPSTD